MRAVQGSVSYYWLDTTFTLICLRLGVAGDEFVKVPYIEENLKLILDGAPVAPDGAQAVDRETIAAVRDGCGSLFAQQPRQRWLAMLAKFFWVSKTRRVQARNRTGRGGGCWLYCGRGLKKRHRACVRACVGIDYC